MTEAGYRLDAIASVVRSELVAAGLPVAPEDHPLGTFGAVVLVDRLINTIDEAMSVAMKTILTAAGLTVVDTDNDYAPNELLVTGRAAESPWQARHDAAVTRRHDVMRAAWNERT